MATIENKQVELTAGHLQQIFKLSASAATKWQPIIKSACDSGKINTVLRLSMFFAQLGHESGDLQHRTENLNYSSDGLMKTFGKYFPNLELAKSYSRNPSKIGARVYASRMGNSHEASGEGYKYRGRGFIQLTGKQNYTSCARSGVRGCDSNPDMLVSDEGAIQSAVWFWNSRSLNSYADRGDFDKTTKIINGGYNGKADRDARYKHCVKVLSGSAAVVGDVEVTPETTTDIEQEPAVTAKQGSVEEPRSAASSVYPHNKVYESTSGHIFEIDDTPGAERLHFLHRSGSYLEIFPDGKVVIKSVFDFHQHVQGDAVMNVRGSRTTVIGDQDYTKVGGDWVVSAGGKLNLVGEKLQVNASLATFSGNLIAKDGEFRALSAEGVADLKARDSEHADVADYAKSCPCSRSAVGASLMSVEDTGSQLSYTIDGLPDPTSSVGRVVIVLDGGRKRIAMSDGIEWVM